jgi:hypothetical protein
MPHALMYENSLEAIDFVGVQTCERQDSQEQSRASKFADRRTLNSIECAGPKFFNGRITKPIRSVRMRLAYSSAALAKVQSWIFLPMPVIEFSPTPRRGSCFLIFCQPAGKLAPFLRRWFAEILLHVFCL